MKMKCVNGVPQSVTITLSEIKAMIAKNIGLATASSYSGLVIDVDNIDISYDTDRYIDDSEVEFEINFKPAPQKTTVVEIDLVNCKG